MLKKWLYVAIALASFLFTTQFAPTQAQTPPETPSLEELAQQSPGFQPDSLPASLEPYSDDDRVIIGEDDRAPVLNRVYPYSTIGRIDWRLADGREAHQCTGTLIGRDLVLTNSHCLTHPLTDEVMGSRQYQAGRDRLIFKPNLIRGVAPVTATVVAYEYGWATRPQAAAEDWALLRLDEPVGDRMGYLGWADVDLSDPEVLSAIAGKMIVAGYAGDFPTAKFRQFGNPGDTAGMHEACSILEGVSRGEMNGILFHQCDTNPGSSGSAIIAALNDGRYVILGLHAGSNEFNRTMDLPTGERTRYINRGVQVNRWSMQAARMR